MTTSAAASFDPASPDFASRRFDLLAAMQAQAPVTYLPALDTWAVTRHHDVRTVLADPGRFPSAGGARVYDHLAPSARAIYDVDRPLFAYAMIDTDRPLQTRLRNAFVAVFGSRRVRELEPTIAADADALLSAMFEPGGVADLVSGFTAPLPARTICRVFGLPLADVGRLREWASAFVTLRVPGLPEEAQVDAAVMFAAFEDYVRELIAGDPGRLHDGLIRDLVEARGRGDHDLTEDELVGNIANVAFAGHETTVSTLSNAFARLLADRRLWTALAGGEIDPDVILEEVLRLDTSVVGLYRWTARATRFDEVEVPARARLWVAYAAANRDPRAFSDPDRLDPSRGRGATPLTFGHGIHSCIGAALARAQIRLALAAVPRAYPQLTLAGPTTEVPVHILRITPALPVTVDAARSL